MDSAPDATPLFSGELAWEDLDPDESNDQLDVARDLVARAAAALDTAPAPVRMDRDARARTEAHDATAVMSHGSILLHPERFDPRSSGAFETIAHEQVHVLQRGVEASPDGPDPEAEAKTIAAQVAAGREPDRPVARLTTPEAADSGKQAPPTPAQIHNLLEQYLSYNAPDVWRAVREHMHSVQFPTPHPRLEWSNYRVFVEKMLAQLKDWVEFRPLEQFDELLYPTNSVKALGAHVPTNKRWVPQVGIAVAHALHIAAVASIKRLAPRYLEVADSRGASGENSVRFDALVTSMPIDRYVGAALCGPSAVSVEPLDAKAAKAAKGKAVGLKAVTLTFEGARDPALWNWVRASPADATAEDVAAKIWRVTDQHGDPSASFAAFQLAAAPPLFGVPKRYAITNSNFKYYAPPDALAGADSVEAQLLQIANSKATDDAALQEKVPTPANAAQPDVSAVLTSLGDCNLQLNFLSKELAPWGLAASVSPALGFVQRKAAELPTADAKSLGDWSAVVEAQKGRLARIAGGVHSVMLAVPQLGITTPSSDRAAPVREILELFAVAAGTSHLAHASEAKLLQAQQQQATLGVRALQSTEATMMGGIRDVHQTAGDNKHTGNLSHEAIALQERSRQMQAQILNGQDVDAEELDDVSMKSQEVALESKMYGTLDGLADLNKAARDAAKGDAAIIASLFSGKFRDLPSLTKHLFDAISPIRNNFEGARKQFDDEEKLGHQSPARKKQQREARRRSLSSAQSRFQQLAEDKDLDKFFKDAAKTIENQQFRTAVVKVAAMIGISIVGGAVAGLASRAVGGVLMQATGATAVAELGVAARAGVAITNIAVDTTISAAGTAAVQGTSFSEAWKENLLVSLSTLAVFGTIKWHIDKQAKVEGTIAKTWADSGKLGKLKIVGKEAGLLGAHTLWGAAMGTVAAKLVTGKSQPPPATIREWALQGISVTIGKHVSQRITARSKAYKALEQQFEDKGRGLAIAAGKLKALAQDVINTKSPAKAVDLLEQHDQFLRQEIEALDRALAKAHQDGGPTDALHARREHLKLAAEMAGSEGMLDTKFALLGMEELVPGALWKGTEDQIKQAIDQAKKGKQKVKHSRNAESKRWTLEVGERKLEVQEVVSAARTVDVERVLLAGDDAELRFAIKLVPPKPGLLDVVVHGTVDDFIVFVGDKELTLNHRSLAKYIEKSGLKYKRIRLLACKSGMHPKGAAQHLANKLGVTVEAPTDKLYIHPDGTLTIGPSETRNTGKWEEIPPKRSESRYEKAPEPERPATTRTRDTTAKVGPKALGRDDQPRDTSAWLEQLKKQLSPDEVEQLGRLRGGWGSADDIEKRFGGDIEAARVQIARITASKAAQESAKQASQQRVSAIRGAAEKAGVLKDPRLAEVVDTLEKELAVAATERDRSKRISDENKAFEKAMEPLRTRAVGDFIAAEALAGHPDRVVMRDVLIMLDSGTDDVAVAMKFFRKSTPNGLRSRPVEGKDRLFLDVSDIDLLVLEPMKTGKLKIVAREEIKTGTRDSPKDARAQLRAQESAINAHATGGQRIRLEHNGVDVTDKIDLSSSGPGTTRGLEEKASGPKQPGQDQFDASLGVRGDDLAAQLRSMLEAELARRDGK